MCALSSKIVHSDPAIPRVDRLGDRWRRLVVTPSAFLAKFEPPEKLTQVIRSVAGPSAMR